MTIKESVDKTYKYSLIFDYALKPDELLYWLYTSKRIKSSEIPPDLIRKISSLENKKRQFRLKQSKIKKKYAHSSLKFLDCIPFVWFVGITGSVSVDNATIEDDIDIFIITAPFTLWIVRPFVLIALEILGIRRSKKTEASTIKNLICPNLWLDVNNLKISEVRQNIFTAHEVLQVFPLINKKLTYEKFIFKNKWVKKYLANAYAEIVLQNQIVFRRPFLKKIESIAGYRPTYLLLAPFNVFFFILQYLFMLPTRNGEIVGWGKAFFHNPNFQKKVLLSIK